MVAGAAHFPEVSFSESCTLEPSCRTAKFLKTPFFRDLVYSQCVLFADDDV